MKGESFHGGVTQQEMLFLKFTSEAKIEHHLEGMLVGTMLTSNWLLRGFKRKHTHTQRVLLTKNTHTQRILLTKNIHTYKGHVGLYYVR